jgi:hypothetical protein
MPELRKTTFVLDGSDEGCVTLTMVLMAWMNLLMAVMLVPNYRPWLRQLYQPQP